MPEWQWENSKGVSNTDDTDRLARNFHVDIRPHGAQHMAFMTHHCRGEIFEYIPGTSHLPGRLGESLAFLARKKITEFAATRQDLIADLVEHIGAQAVVGERDQLGNAALAAAMAVFTCDFHRPGNSRRPRRTCRMD